MDEIISYKMCAVKVRNATLRNYLKLKAQFSFVAPKLIHPFGMYLVVAIEPCSVIEIPVLKSFMWILE
jgi:hypothetical protein